VHIEVVPDPDQRCVEPVVDSHDQVAVVGPGEAASLTGASSPQMQPVEQAGSDAGFDAQRCSMIHLPLYSTLTAQHGVTERLTVHDRIDRTRPLTSTAGYKIAAELRFCGPNVSA